MTITTEQLDALKKMERAAKTFLIEHFALDRIHQQPYADQRHGLPALDEVFAAVPSLIAEVRRLR